MIQKLADLRNELTLLEKTAAVLVQQQRILADFADMISRGAEETINGPRELRRIADSLGDSAGTLKKIAAHAAKPRHPGSLMEICRTVSVLKQELEGENQRAKDPNVPASPGLRSHLREMTALVGRLYEICTQLTLAEYYARAGIGIPAAGKETLGHLRS